MTRNRKGRISLIFTILFLLFLTIMDYPFLARLYNSRVQGEVVLLYEEHSQSLEEQEQEKLRQEAATYNEQLASGLVQGIRENWEEKVQEEKNGEEGFHEVYESLLNSAGDGIMGMVEIPKLQVNLPVYHGTSEEVLQKGAGHLEGSSLPVGGENTHTCISAHRGLADRKMFTNLDEMEVGDIFILHTAGEDLYYQVFKIQTVLPDEVESLAIQRGQDLATLITCTPYGINTHRLYVQGKRVEPTPEVQEQVQQAEQSIRWQDWWWVPVSIALILMMALLLWRYNRKN